MAILNMKKAAFIAHSENRECVLKRLQDIGAVEVVKTSLEELEASQAPGTLIELEKKLGEVREALEVIRKYDETKSGILTAKPAITKSGLKDMDEKLEETDEAVEKIRQFTAELSALKTREHRLQNRIMQLEPYAKFDATLESIKENDYTVCLLGTIPADNIENYRALSSKYEQSAYFEDIERDKDYLSVYVVMAKEVDEELTGELKYIGFAEAFTKELYGTPADLIFDLNNECESLNSEAAEYEEKAKKYVDYKLTLQAVEDYLLNEIARERCIERLGATGSTFMLSGWVVQGTEEAVEKAVLEAAPEAYVTFEEPAEGDKVPTAVKNPGVVAPFEAVTDMYATTSQKAVDPNLLMSIFYFLIFGMMMADMAYGVMLMLGAFLMLKKKKPTGMFRKVTTVILICGISTALWGVFYGNLFGLELYKGVINPIDDAMTMLIICIAIGVVHILVGLGIGAYQSIRRGKVWDALFDKVTWMLILIGAAVFAIGMVFEGPFSTIALVLVGIGFATLLFTAGRKKKSVVGKVIGGVASLYDVTGYVSDILSYCRIFGMGLATTVIAMVFNTIATLLFGGVVGYIAGAIVLTIGHVFNLAINTLGSFVHTARLQYIEFFSKFYEDGGHAFAPLGLRTKNYRIEEQK